MEKADAILAKDIDAIACVGVNDAFVMDAWGERHQADKIAMLADGNAQLARAMGLEMDATSSGMGVRSKRYAAIVENGVVRELHVEKPGEFSVSSAAAILERLP